MVVSFNGAWTDRRGSKLGLNFFDVDSLASPEMPLKGLHFNTEQSIHVLVFPIIGMARRKGGQRGGGIHLPTRKTTSVSRVRYSLIVLRSDTLSRYLFEGHLRPPSSTPLYSPLLTSIEVSLSTTIHEAATASHADYWSSKDT
uniref:Uncharacterized protein n=1 Tax=Timema poppense TaxID=170557 RepID=A0A7R9DD34_TIMPO|nr:unnamed protein product [Timema poppensis]